MKKLLFITAICFLCGTLSTIQGLNGFSENREEEKMTPHYLYRIVSTEDWQKSQEQKQVVTSAIDKDFIHLSTEEQVPQTAQKFWKGKDYVILKLDSKKLDGRLVYETNPGGATRYYHLYDGKIPLEAVVNSKVVKA